MAEFDRKNYTLVHRDWEKYPPRNFPEHLVKLFRNYVIDPVVYFKSMYKLRKASFYLFI